MGLVVTPRAVRRVSRSVSRPGEPGQDRRGVAEGGALGGGEAAELLGQPGVAALAVRQHGRAPGVGERDDDLPAVGVVRPAHDVAVGLQAVDRAGHRRRLHALGAGQVADGLVAEAHEQPEDDHLADAQVVVGVALGDQAAAHAHDTGPEL